MHVFILQKLNPWNKRGTDDLIAVSELTHKPSFNPADVMTDFPALRETPDKKFYLAMDFNKIDNYHFHDVTYYPIAAVERPDHLYLPQMNHISTVLPYAPPLSQLGDITEVRRLVLSYAHSQFSIRNS